MKRIGYRYKKVSIFRSNLCVKMLRWRAYIQHSKFASWSERVSGVNDHSAWRWTADRSLSFCWLLLAQAVD